MDHNEKSGNSALETPPQRPNTNDVVGNGTVHGHSPNVDKKTGKRVLTPEECEDQLPFTYSEFKKWWILSVIFLVQVSMNFNTSLYSNGLGGISDKFGVSEQAARVGAAIFLVLYAFGCELWAPWSEEIGRKPVLQASLFLVNVFTLPVALAPNFGVLLMGRALGGLSSAGGSVTLGMIADMFDSDHQQLPVAYIVFSSVGGSILGPIVGGFCEQYLAWQWTIWIQLIFGVFVQVLHFVTVPETRETVVLTRIAKQRRKLGEDVWGPDEVDPLWERLTMKELLHTWARPFRMFITEPIVLWLSLLSGFSDALIFMMIQSFALVYKQYDFTPSQIGLSFIPIGIGYVIAWLMFIPAIKRNIAQRKKRPEDEKVQYESRMDLLLVLVPCLPIGLIIFAWTSTGPPLHWIGTMVASAIIGIANYSIYMATIDYMICAYGPYSASATGGNGWARDFLAGVLTVPATPFYTNIGAEKGMNLPYASTILFCISAVLVTAVYVIYWKGPILRANSPFAQSLAHGVNPEKPGESLHREPSAHIGPTSRRSSYMGAKKASSRQASRNVSRANSYDGSAAHPNPHQRVAPAELNDQLNRLTTVRSEAGEQ
ncbi:putative MFS multidrug transporter [Pseudomassariella vexata]|uniref:Putative MFS multidrug transporter n=1 Tax=Pseudomassariella vexata TaxID=1141098 RepID=A0A1Y2DIR0_9PEZI|nr:putative MFS multidrug transporter [Pseudomassariella vexata]ORY59119.1 putative MFS multidrug transporter [Pseudomassariella vexata]